MIDLQGTATAGVVVILAVLIAFVIEPAGGHNGNPYTVASTIRGLAYAIAVAALRWRS